MIEDTSTVTEFPRALESYPSAADQTLAADLAARVQIEPFNAIATGVFLLAILHTFAAARVANLAHRMQRRRFVAAIRRSRFWKQRATTAPISHHGYAWAHGSHACLDGQCRGACLAPGAVSGPDVCGQPP